MNCTDLNDLMVSSVIKDLKMKDNIVGLLIDQDTLNKSNLPIIDYVYSYVDYNDRYIKVLVPSDQVEISDTAITVSDIPVDRNKTIHIGAPISKIIQITMGYGTSGILIYDRLPKVTPNLRVSHVREIFPHLNKLLEENVIKTIRNNLDSDDNHFSFSRLERLRLDDLTEYFEVIEKYHEEPHFFVEFQASATTYTTLVTTYKNQLPLGDKIEFKDIVFDETCSVALKDILSIRKHRF